MKKTFQFLLLILFCFSSFVPYAFAQSAEVELDKAKLTSVNYKEVKIDNQVSKLLEIHALGSSGIINNREISFEQSLAPTVDKNLYAVGDEVYISVSQDNGEVHYGISDFVRSSNQLILFIIFFIVLILVGGFKGFRSLIGLVLSLLLIVLFIIPNILNGNDALLISIIGSAVILIPTVLFVHGFNRKSLTAIIGSILSLLIAALLAYIFTQSGKITGVGNDDTLYLLIGGNTKIKAQGLFLAGVVIGTLGVLIDMTIGQASAIKEINDANPILTVKELYISAMNVGRDHIGSLVNTLFLAYAAASLPILISFTQSKQPLLYTLSQETTAMEIIRAIVGSIALILAVPLTTLIGIYLFKRKKNPKTKGRSFRSSSQQ